MAIPKTRKIIGSFELGMLRNSNRPHIGYTSTPFDYKGKETWKGSHTTLKCVQLQTFFVSPNKGLLKKVTGKALVEWFSGKVNEDGHVWSARRLIIIRG